MRIPSRIRRGAAAAIIAGTIFSGGLSSPVSAVPLPLPDSSGTDAGKDTAGDASGSSPIPDYSAPVDETFYNTSGVTPGAPGSILRTQKAAMAPLPEGLDYPIPSSVTKVLYSTTDMFGNAIPVSGYLVEPSVPWTGAGDRPTVVIGRGTVGQGDQCAPSRNWPVGGQADPITTNRLVNLEGLYDWVFSSAGVRVFVTDYIGMGTPGIHTYMNRAEQAHAMIDGARAAHNLSGSSGKIAFYGHSQGGGASAAAVEEVGSYAPELDVAAAYASAPPANLDDVQRGIDGSDLVGAIGFTINGLAERYPELDAVLDRSLNDVGRKALPTLATMCTNEITAAYGGHRTNEWTIDGRSLDETIADIPEAQKAMEDQRIGRGVPAAPTMIVSGRHDLNVDYQQARDLADQWCSNGGQVYYRDDILPKISTYNHFAQAVSGAPFGISFLLAMFNGAPAEGACMGPVVPGGYGEIPLPGSS